MTSPYDEIVGRLREIRDPQRAIDFLDDALPRLWHRAYLNFLGGTADVVVISLGDQTRIQHFCRYMFHHTTPQNDVADRVIAVWGTSMARRASGRDHARMAGFIRNCWSHVYQGYDRGHFFAHTMGGRLDINLFPQNIPVNRWGKWRRLESYCSRNPGTFCFIRPFYSDVSWIPDELEYGILKTTSRGEQELLVEQFRNRR